MVHRLLKQVKQVDVHAKGVFLNSRCLFQGSTNNDKYSYGTMTSIAGIGTYGKYRYCYTMTSIAMVLLIGCQHVWKSKGENAFVNQILSAWIRAVKN